MNIIQNPITWIIVVFSVFSFFYFHFKIRRVASIKCAWCGKIILCGDPITLYTPCQKDFKIPKHAVVYKKSPLQLVGCLRWNCAESGVDRAGFWLFPGKVQRALSPIEECFASGKVVAVNNVSDIEEAKLL